MAQKSYFFDSVDHDRIYTTSDFARVFGAITGRDGVVYGYGEELTVSPGSDMNVTVGTGAAFVQGRMLEVYSAAETLSIAAADATNPRIDRVVIRVDLSTAQRRGYLAVKVGTPAATPAAPILQQDATIWEMSLAQVQVSAGATGVVVGDIADEREYASLATDQLLAHLADLGNPHAVTAEQIPYASTVEGFDPALVSAGLDVLARDGAMWRRVDTLTAPVEITSTDYTDPTIVPLSKPYSGTSIYAVNFWISNADNRSNNIAFFKGGASASAGRMIAGVGSPFAEGVCLVSRIRVPGQDNAIGFFNAMDLGEVPVLLYVASVFAVKEGV